MLANHAEFIAGSSGSVVGLSDLFEASITNHVSKKPISAQIDAPRLSDNIKKVSIINEGAGDAAGLLGNCCIDFKGLDSFTPPLNMFALLQ